MQIPAMVLAHAVYACVSVPIERPQDLTEWAYCTLALLCKTNATTRHLLNKQHTLGV